jgi:hypothetical protein
MKLLESIHWDTVRLDPKDHSKVHPDERAALMALHVEQEVALDRRMDHPNLALEPVMIPLVARREGQIIGGLYVEAVGEVCFIGRDPLVSSSGLRIAGQVFGNLQCRGFRFVRMQIPNAKWIGAEADIIGTMVRKAGFVLQDEYDHYLYDLRGGRIPAVSMNGQEGPHDSDKAVVCG